MVRSDIFFDVAMTWKSSLKDSISNFYNYNNPQPSQNFIRAEKKKKTPETEREKIEIGADHRRETQAAHRERTNASSHAAWIARRLRIVREPGRNGARRRPRTVRNPGRDGARPRPRETQVVRGPGLLRLLSDLILLSP